MDSQINSRHDMKNTPMHHMTKFKCKQKSSIINHTDVRRADNVQHTTARVPAERPTHNCTCPG